MRGLLPLFVLLGCPGGASSPPPVASSTDLPTPTVVPTPDDQDGDGFGAETDCDDADPQVFPGADEICDGVDSNCDGIVEGETLVDGVLSCRACDDAGWYVPTLGLNGAALRNAIRDSLGDISCSYNSARPFMFGTLDNDGGTITCVYTGATAAPDGTNVPGGVLNTEHSWPQSEGADVAPARCDLHHLYPVEQGANSRRGSLPFGEVTGSVDWSQGGSRLGDGPSGELVFEPPLSHRGNVARSLLYFELQYDIPLPTAYRALLQQWSDDDPVDADEQSRTLAIQEEQGELNPLVVCPHLVERL